MTDQPWRGGRAELAAGAVALVALVVRGVGLDYGLPSIDPAEDWIRTFGLLDRAVGSHVMDPLASGVHAGLLHLEYLFTFLRLREAPAGLAEFGVRMVEDPTEYWTLARIGMVVVGSATVALLARHGVRLGGLRVGVLAAWFLAVAVQHVEMSRRVAPDVILALFVLWSLALIIEASVEGRPVRPWAFVLVAAAAARAGWPGILLLVPYLVACGRGGRAARFLTPAALLPAALAAGVAALAASTPSPSLSGVGAASLSTMERLAGGAALAEAVDSLMRSVGPAVLLLAGVATVVGGLRNWPGVRLHLVYAGVLAVAIPLGWAEPRVAVVILPVVCLLAAFGLDYLVRRLHCTRFVTVATAVALAALLTIEPATACWRAVQRDRAKDTRDLAADWFGENAAARAVILVSGTSQDVKWPYFPLPDLKRNLNERLPAMRRDDPGALRYWETELQLDRERRYDLRPESEGGEWATGSKMGGPGGVYVVGPGAWLQEQWAVGESVEVMAVFEPSWPESKGTQLEIWRLAPPAPVIPPVASSN